MEREGIGAGFLFTTVSTHCFVVEPVFFWPDVLTEIHRDTVEPGVLKKLPGFDENLEARRAVARIREELLEFFCDMGAAHLQIGKAYRYKEGLKSPSWELVRQLKKVLDPGNRINPGAVGLGGMRVKQGYINVGSEERPQLIHYRTAGTGPALVMLHASPMSSAALLPFIGVAAEHATVIAPDTPGYGWSDPLLEPGGDLSGYVAALHTFTERLGLESFSLYGTATGAPRAI